MPLTTFVRKEKKYLINCEQKNALLKRLSDFMIFDKYCQNGHKYTVNNIYFDTPTFNVIRNSLSGPTYKEKIRIRSYIIAANDDDTAFLEVKKKVAGVVNKRRIVLKLGDLDKYIAQGIRPDNLTTQQVQIFNEIDYALSFDKLSPAVYLSYRRIALFGKDDPSLRITIDEDIITRTYDMSLHADRYGDELLPEGQFLMEIKASGAYPMWLAHLLSEFKIYPTSFSKYGTFYRKKLKERIGHE